MQTFSIYIHVTGLVQGVGFRPFVYRLALANNLKGWVDNRNDGVHIQLEGNEDEVNTFLINLKNQAPPASNIDQIIYKIANFKNFKNFEIVKSKNSSEEITEISPDIAVCDDCLRDLKNQNHRINYPFTNCTNCGPRFSIIQDLPYDREQTTMCNFDMCAICKAEYLDKLNRRFHAQPVACNHCGPIYELQIEKRKTNDFAEITSIVSSAIDNGKILAIKGIGGFHLACNALDNDVVLHLRKRKQHESKPFAVMIKNIDLLQRIAIANDSEKQLLQSWRKPIVLFKEKNNTIIPVSVSNRLGTIGVMLPYMPFHYLLFEKLKTEIIVLTSGNIAGEPIVINNYEAEKKLLPIADLLLTYNRDIYNRTDDSVVFITSGKERIIRRSRGYVPSPIKLNFAVDGILAMGAELKNCFCIGKGNKALLSQHIGDLKNLETYNYYTETIAQFQKLFRVKPLLLVGDRHPDYLSTRYLQLQNIPYLQVQHHHAHIVSCMVEHGESDQVIGISFDGTGFGDDGNIWGGEFLICDLKKFERQTHFEYVPMPGGDRVSAEPWRMAVSYLYHFYKSEFLNWKLPFLKDVSEEKVKLILVAIDKKINTPFTSSAGRLFDAVAALIGICTYSGFEAEAPMRLESLIDSTCNDSYLYAFNKSISFKPMFDEILSDLENKISTSIIAAKFHNTLLKVILEVSEFNRKKNGISKVVLSGGVFQNRYLLAHAERLLLENKFDVMTHNKVPSNDGGIALGQLVIAAHRKM